LPPEYAEWIAFERSPRVTSVQPEPAAAGTPFRILSPADGDRYRIPPGIDRRYATLALRAYNPGDARLRWLVDGRPVGSGRWPLVPGAHTIRAVSANGASDQVRIVVEP
jgi:membrane carboxypeptidase/penicillin-binding protein PbpC